MAIPEQFLEDLKARVDMVDLVSSYVHLTRKGSNYWGLCPFHNEKTPSFSVSPDKQMCYCFGCHKGGGPINFIREVESLDFVDAVRLLAQRYGMEVPESGEEKGAVRQRARSLEANREAAMFYHEYLKSPGGEGVRAYLKQRRLSGQIVTRFGLGAAPAGWDELTKALTAKGYSKAELLEAGLAVAGKNGNIYDKFRGRLMLPIVDTSGNVPGFTSRILPGQEGAKYLNSPETAVFKKGKLIYGLNLAKKTKRKNLILVEGNIDVISLHQAGFDNAVAAMGTSFTADHARALSKVTHEVVVCLDNDESGQRAVEGVLRELANVEVAVRVLRLPNVTDERGELVLDEKGKPMKQDPDDFIKKYGAAAFEKYLESSSGQNDYRLENLRSSSDLTSEEGRLAFLKKAVETVGALPSPIEREVYGSKAAAMAGISEEAMKAEIARYRKAGAKKEKKQEQRREQLPTVRRQPEDRSIRYENMASASAEEGVIRLLFRDETLLPLTRRLEEGHFSSPFLGEVYRLIRERIASGLSPDLDALGEHFTTSQMSHLAGVLRAPESMAYSQKAMEDYIDVIETEHLKRSSRQSDDALLAAREKFREKKGYGG